MRKILFATLMILAGVVPAQAAPACYSAEEMKAEKLLRLHSELMVITVTCKQGSTGRDLGRAYTGLTRQHIKVIQEAEKTLKDHYAQTVGGNGLSQLDTLRTKLANEFGQQVADESAPAFCARLRDKVTQFYDSRGVSMAEESVRAYPASLSGEPLCGNAVRAAADPSDDGVSGAVLAKNNPKKTKGKVGS